MKIIVVTSLTTSATANYLIRAMVDAEHQLFVCSDIAGPLVDQVVTGAADVDKISRRHGFDPDLVLFIEGGSMQLFPNGMERMPCLTAWYGIDTHMDYAKHLRIGRLFDITFIAQKEFVDRLRADGLQQVFWLPLAFAPELHPLERQDRCYDVAYVGSDNAAMHPVRHDLLEALRREIQNVFQGTATPRDMGRIYAQAKMAFNKSVNNDVNMRYFEAMGAGAVLLTDHANANGVEELFMVGEHFLEYSDEVSLLTLVRELLRDGERLRGIGESARRHILEHHTYGHRAERLLNEVSNGKKEAHPLAGDYFAVFIELRMADAALLAAEKAFDWKNAGASSRLMGMLAMQGVRWSRVVVMMFDRVRRGVRTISRFVR